MIEITMDEEFLESVARHKYKHEGEHACEVAQGLVEVIEDFIEGMGGYGRGAEVFVDKLDEEMIKEAAKYLEQYGEELSVPFDAEKISLLPKVQELVCKVLEEIEGDTSGPRRDYIHRAFIGELSDFDSQITRGILMIIEREDEKEKCHDPNNQLGGEVEVLSELVAARLLKPNDR